MKILFLILFLSAKALLYSQDTVMFNSVISYFKEQEIKLNTVNPPSGFKVYYNCDSLLFMRGNFGDTIKIWTSASDWYIDLDKFKEVSKYKRFGKTEFVKDIDLNGRILLSSYHQTQFIYRNDSLFEIENSNPIPCGALTNLIILHVQKQIDDSTFKVQRDSLKLLEEKTAVYTPKLIFAKRMFQKNKKIKLSKKLNFQGDMIELERQWIQNGKTCYLVRINNKEDGEETSYAYAINEDMKFIFWEGCDRQ